MAARALPLPKALLWRDGVTFAVVLGLLLAPWPGLASACSSALAATLNFLGAERVLDSGVTLALEPLGKSAFQPAIHASPLWHVFLVATNPATGASPRLAFNTRGAFYLPSATFVAFLVAARAWRWERPRRALLAGAVVLGSFTTLSVLVAALSFLAMPEVGGISLGASTRTWLEAFFLGWFAAPGMGYAAALLAATCALFAGHGSKSFGLGREPTLVTRK
jgi:hypothetical protein